jgi:hypothetical protein
MRRGLLVGLGLLCMTGCGHTSDAYLRVLQQPSSAHPLPQWGMKPTVFRGANS